MRRTGSELFQILYDRLEIPEKYVKESVSWVVFLSEFGSIGKANIRKRSVTIYLPFDKECYKRISKDVVSSKHRGYKRSYYTIFLHWMIEVAVKLIHKTLKLRFEAHKHNKLLKKQRHTVYESVKQGARRSGQDPKIRPYERIRAAAERGSKIEEE
jgi:hypothetical protein